LNVINHTSSHSTAWNVTAGLIQQQRYGYHTAMQRSSEHTIFVLHNKMYTNRL